MDCCTESDQSFVIYSETQEANVKNF